jgi:polysaccharide deacetylase family protein (PEP-CTERM system associated)
VIVDAKAGIVNAMSVDVEDYFQVSAFDTVVSRASWDTRESRVVQNTNRLLDLFARHGVRATFFVLGWVAQRFPALVRDIAARGHEIASHGYYHQLLYTLTPKQFREDVRSAKAALESVSGGAVVGYRAPSFSIISSSLWALDVLMEEGYVYDASIFPVHHDRYGIPDAKRHVHSLERTAGPIIEVPASTVRLGGVNLPIAGGGYFRLLPYAWTRWGIDRVNRAEGRPVVFYVHPWEIDPDQPRFDVGAATRLRHYTGLRSTMPRLERLLNDFGFDSITGLLQRPDTVRLKADTTFEDVRSVRLQPDPTAEDVRGVRLQPDPTVPPKADT